MWIVMEDQNFYFYYGQKDMNGEVILQSNKESIN